jgi:hypothetical protein
MAGVGRASCLYRMRSLEAAVQSLMKGIESHWNKAELSKNPALILTEQGLTRRALQTVRSAVDIEG